MATKENKTVVHWIRIDPFDRYVYLVVGDLAKGIDQIFRTLVFRPPMPSKEDIVAQVTKDLPTDFGAQTTKYCQVGRCALVDIGVVIWFPRFPLLSILAHELSHAVDFIEESIGAQDSSGEVSAYLLGFLFNYFVSKVNMDLAKGRKKPVEEEII